MGQSERKTETVIPRRRWKYDITVDLNPLNTKLISICHLLALLEAHHILHISRIRVNFGVNLDWILLAYGMVEW